MVKLVLVDKSSRYEALLIYPLCMARTLRSLRPTTTHRLEILPSLLVIKMEL